MGTTSYKHTIDATVIQECRCFVILAWMCFPIQLSAFAQFFLVALF